MLYPGQSRVRMVFLFDVSEIGRNRLNFCVMYYLKWLPVEVFLRSEQIHLDVSLRALQASIDGMNFVVDRWNHLSVRWPARTPITEK